MLVLYIHAFTIFERVSTLVECALCDCCLMPSVSGLCHIELMEDVFRLGSKFKLIQWHLSASEEMPPSLLRDKIEDVQPDNGLSSLTALGV